MIAVILGIVYWFTYGVLSIVFLVMAITKQKFVFVVLCGLLLASIIA
jgi:hypothetical protein